MSTKLQTACMYIIIYMGQAETGQQTTEPFFYLGVQLLLNTFLFVCLFLPVEIVLLVISYSIPVVL